MFSRFVIIAVLSITTGYCHGQETDAERDGEAIISVDMGATEFASVELHWRDTMAWHASIHCKQSRDNCRSDDKQIRYHDVVIMDITEVNNAASIEVIFHIRDRYDHMQAGMTSQQVRSFFLKYESDVEEHFQPGTQMSLVAPGEAGMEPWLIAVIVISCVVGLALIVTVAVLASNQRKFKQEQKRIDELANDLQKSQTILLPGYASLPDGKINPGYDSDNEKATTSVASSQRGSTIAREPPPAYFNHTVSPEVEPEVVLTHVQHNTDQESRSSGRVSDADYAVIDHATKNRKSDYESVNL